MKPEHGTRLNNGTSVTDHDDWNCVQDMAQEGLFDFDAESVQPGFTLKLSPKGQAWASALRIHKQGGGNFSDFDVSQAPAVASPAPREREVFSWFQLEIDVTAIHDDIEAGKLRPKKLTFDREAIEQFATQVQGLKMDEPNAERCSIFTGIRACEVHEVPESAYEKPAILVYVGKGRGILNFGDGANYVLVDGNKRIGKAFFTGRTEMAYVLLNQAQTRKYKC
jgi:hypothetical protein